jgi:hypothetical protein
MIIETPRNSPLRGLSKDKQETFHEDAATEALDMVRGILGSLRCAVYPDTSTIITTAELYGAVEAALFIAELAQDHVDHWRK